MKNAKSLVGKSGVSVVGILTDNVVLEKKKEMPILSFDERMNLAHAIKYNDFVVAQETYSPLSNIKKIRPDVVMESDSHNAKEIDEVRTYLESIGGRVIINPYHPYISSTIIKQKIREK